MLIDLPPASLIIIIVFQYTKSSDSFILPIIIVRSSLDKRDFSITNPRLLPRLRISKILFELICEFTVSVICIWHCIWHCIHFNRAILNIRTFFFGILHGHLPIHEFYSIVWTEQVQNISENVSIWSELILMKWLDIEIIEAGWIKFDLKIVIQNYDSR